MKTCLIIGASPCKSYDFLREIMTEAPFVFAADGGLRIAEAAGIHVDAFVGDFDSNSTIPKCGDVTVLPCEKDYGDIHTAVNRALADGYKKIYLAGCTNGRADHYFANVALLELISKNGGEGIILDDCNQIRFITEGVHHIPRMDRYLSVLSIDEMMYGVTLKGLKYPLNNATIYRDTPIGISNEWVSDNATIEFEKGRALLIFSEDDKK